MRSTVMSINMKVNMTLTGNNVAKGNNKLGIGGAMHIIQSQVNVTKSSWTQSF